MKNLLRAAVAFATVLAGLTLTAGPASATIINAQVTGGTVTVAKTGQPGFTFPLVTTGTGCGSTAAAIDIAVPSTTGPVDLPTLTTVGRFQATAAMGSSHYVAEVTRIASTAGTGNTTATPDSITALGATLTIRFYQATDQTATGTSCTHGTVRCAWTAAFTFGGIYSGNLTTPLPNDIATLGTPASTALTGTTCNSPFSAYTSGAATVVNSTLQLLAGQYPVEITGGTVAFVKGSVSLTVPLVTTGTGCGSTGQLDINVFGTTGPVNLSQVTTTSRFLHPGTSDYYIAKFSRFASTDGTGNATADTITSAGARITVQFFWALNNTGAATDCATTGSAVCTWIAPTYSLSGTYSGDLNSPAGGDVATLSSPASTSQIGPCSAPLATLNGGTGTISSMGVTLL